MENNRVIASIDIGTNSFHMAIADVNSSEMLNILAREKEMVRLGSSSTDMKYLQSDAIDRGYACLKRFKGIADTYNAEIYAIATSATREAENKDEFISLVKEDLGIEIEVVSGSEEARLIYLGVLHSLPVFDKKTLVIDIGGGSTETIIGKEGTTNYVHSEKIGTIRLTRRFFDDEDFDSRAIDECREFIKGQWSPILEKIKKEGFEKTVFTSGTLQNLVVMVHAKKHGLIYENVNGLSATKEEVLDTINDVIKCKCNSDRAKLEGLDPKRSDIILAGSLIIELVLKELDINEVTVSAFALREGIIFDVLRKKKEIENYEELSSLRTQTIYNLCNHYSVDMKHSEYVKKISVNLFYSLQKLHNFTAYEREMLEAAALLHDVGYNISHDFHHKHSYYIIRHSIMPGFTNDESDLIANIARYHRKSLPKNKHTNYYFLSDKKKQIVKVLSGILRIAEGLDRRQIQIIDFVESHYTDNNIHVYLYHNENVNPDIELWGVNRRKEQLEKIFSKNVNFHLKQF